MNQLLDPLFRSIFVGSVYFIPYSEESAVCELEFVQFEHADLLARLSMKGSDWAVSDLLLMCPDGEQRFRSQKEVAVYGDAREVQLLLHRDRLTLVTVDGAPHLRVVGEWRERTLTASARSANKWWVFEGLLKQGAIPVAQELDARDVATARSLRRSWQAVCA